MKIYVHSSAIYAMAIPRRDAVDKMQAIKPTMVRHIMRIAVYGDSLGCLDHWINEVSSYLSTVNDITIKSSTTKLSEKDYIEYLVGTLGTNRNDASVNVRMLQIEVDEKTDYPEFEITSDMIDRAFKISQIVRNFVLEIITHKNSLKKRDIYYYLKNRIDNNFENDLD